MKNFAILNNNNDVINIIVAENKEIAEEITTLKAQEYDPSTLVAIGFNWDGEKFNPPPMPQEMIDDLLKQDASASEQPTE